MENVKVTTPFGLGAQAMALKQRNLKDASSFIDKETEVSTALN